MQLLSVVGSFAKQFHVSKDKNKRFIHSLCLRTYHVSNFQFPVYFVKVVLHVLFICVYFLLFHSAANRHDKLCEDDELQIVRIRIKWSCTFLNVHFALCI
jgi:hypothetical protein